MEIIGAGFGRTGTTSLAAALERLGLGPSYHMTEVFKNPPHAKFWERAANGEAVKWREVLDGYGSAVDWPVCSFYEELMAEYPEAKVILTVRDPIRWHESVRATIYEINSPGSGSYFARFVAVFVPHMRSVRRMVDELIWYGTFDGRFEDREYAIEIFERHITDVKAKVPPEKLLVYEVGEGWEPLCGFLGVSVPDEPFPRLNDARTFRAMILAGNILAFTVPVSFAVVAAIMLRRMLRSRASARSG